MGSTLDIRAAGPQQEYMTHRDDRLAIEAKLEARTRELDEARAENELLREAQIRATLEAQALHRALDAGAPPPPEPPDEHVEAPEEEEPSGPPTMNVAAQRASRRFMGVASSTALFVVVGLMVMSAMLAARAHHARMAGAGSYATAPLATQVTPLVRTGFVATVEGTDVVRPDDQCTVERVPVDASPFDCRIVVTCEGHVLYGADPRTGFNQCAGLEWVQDPETTPFDGDPALIMDVALDVVTIEDRVGLETQRVRIRI